MIWIVCGVFIGGFFVGVVFMALLTMAREPEIRPPLPDEIDAERMRGSHAPEAAVVGVWYEGEIVYRTRTSLKDANASHGPRPVCREA